MLRRRDQTVRSLRVEHYSSAVNSPPNPCVQLHPIHPPRLPVRATLTEGYTRSHFGPPQPDRPAASVGKYCSAVLIPIHSQFRVVGHDLGGTTHRTCPLSDFEPRPTWLKGATWEIPAELSHLFCDQSVLAQYGIREARGPGLAGGEEASPPQFGIPLAGPIAGAARGNR